MSRPEHFQTHSAWKRNSSRRQRRGQSGPMFNSTARLPLGTLLPHDPTFESRIQVVPRKDKVPTEQSEKELPTFTQTSYTASTPTRHRQSTMTGNGQSALANSHQSPARDNRSFADMARNAITASSNASTDSSLPPPNPQAGMIKLKPNRTGRPKWEPLNLKEHLQSDQPDWSDENFAGDMNRLNIGFEQYHADPFQNGAAAFQHPRRRESYATAFPTLVNAKSGFNLQQTSDENLAEVIDVFGETLPNPEVLAENRGSINGEICFVQHTNGDISAHQWSDPSGQWMNIGQYSQSRKRIEGQLSTDHLRGQSITSAVPPDTLRYFRGVAKQRDASQAPKPGLSGLGAQFQPASYSPNTAHNPRDTNAVDATSTPQTAYTTSSGSTIKPQYRAGTNQSAYPGVAVGRDDNYAFPYQANDDPFVGASPMPSMPSMQSMQSMQSTAGNVSGINYQNPGYQFPQNQNQQNHGFNMQIANQPNPNQGRMTYPSVQEMLSIRQDLWPSTPQYRPSYNKGSFGQTAKKPPESTAPPIPPGFEESSARKCLGFPTNNDNNSSAYPMDAYQYEGGSGDRKELLEGSVPLQRKYENFGIGDQSPESINKQRMLDHYAQEPHLSYDPIITPALVAAQQSLASKRTPAPYIHDAEGPPTVQNFNGPFFAGSNVPPPHDPTRHHAYSMEHNAALDNWWKNGMQSERQDDFYRRVMATKKLDQKQTGGHGAEHISGQDGDCMKDINRTLLAVYENLADYVHGPKDKSFARFGPPPPHAVDNSPGAHFSLFDYPEGTFGARGQKKTGTSGGSGVIGSERANRHTPMKESGDTLQVPTDRHGTGSQSPGR